MAVAMLLEWADMGESKYSKLIENLTLGGSMYTGAILHLAGPADGGWRVVDVWESQEAFDRFFADKLQDAVQATGIAPPSVQTWPVHAIMTPQGAPTPQK